SAAAATMSWRQRPHRNIAMVAARIARTRTWGRLMIGYRMIPDTATRRDSGVGVAEFLAEPLGELRGCHTVVLGAVAGDLDRPHQRRDAAGGRPVEALGEAVQHAAPEGVAAAGRVDGIA